MGREKSFFWGLYSSKETEPEEQRAAKVTWDDFFTIAGPTKSGVTVNTDTASTLSAVYRAVNIWGDSLNVPVYHYKKTDAGRESITNSQIYRLLHNKPNRVMTPAMFFSSMEWSRFFYGNAYAYIKRTKFGDPLELVWLHPDTVDIKTNPDEIGSPLYYDIRNENGETIYRDVPDYYMIHVRALSYDGMSGRAIIDVGSEVIGNGISAQDYGSNFWQNGSRSDGVLLHPGSLGEKANKNLKDSFDKDARKGGIQVLEEGMKYIPRTFDNQASQFIESKKLNVSDIARLSGVPEHMLFNNDPTYSNVEHMALSFVTHNVRPRARTYEQEFNNKLCENGEYVKFNLDALLRADSKTRAEVERMQVEAGIRSRDEARELENLNDIDGGYGSEYLTPMNMITDKEREKDDGQGKTD